MSTMTAASRRLTLFYTTTCSISALLALRPSLLARSTRVASSVRRLSVALLFLLTVLVPNVKALPFSWLIRVLRSLSTQIYTSPHALGPADLFRPAVVRTWANPLECDHNWHKSNSTYFADLDTARSFLVGAVVRTGFRRLLRGDKRGLDAYETDDAKTGRAAAAEYLMALGGTACTFRKEIKPLERYEIWTRVLAWDEKWLYVVSHFVKPGAIVPKGYTLQPWKRGGLSCTERLWSVIGLEGRTAPAAASAAATRDEGEARRKVFATSITKYVCKKGRVTVPMELVLARSGLLPRGPRPAHLPLAPLGAAESAVLVGHGTEDDSVARPVAPEIGVLEQIAAVPRPLAPDEVGDLTTGQDGHGAMSWEEIEKVRLRGLKYAAMFDGLAGLHDDFGGAGTEEEVIGVYGDVFY